MTQHHDFMKYGSLAMCSACCTSMLAAFILGGGTLFAGATYVDYSRMSLIVAGWTAIGVATLLMWRRDRQMVCCQTTPRKG
jgi:hypothetical protein